jgi:hypothetical protein
MRAVDFSTRSAMLASVCGDGARVGGVLEEEGGERERERERDNPRKKKNKQLSITNSKP